jgi:tetratricopeptide (TPR) repeat protein
MAAAVVLGGFFVFGTFQLWPAAMVSLVLTIGVVCWWLWTGTAHHPEKDSKDIGLGVRLPLYVSGPGSVGWWGLFITMLADMTAFLSLVFYDSYRLALTAGTIAREGQVAEATELLRRAVAIAPDDVSAHFQLGMLALSQNDIATAREELQRCTVMAPEFADAWLHLSDLQAKQGDAAASERTLAEGLRRCPQSPSLNLMRARRLREAGRTGEAIVEFGYAIRYRPNEPEAYIDLGSFYLDLGRDAEAIKQFQLALDAEPGNPAALGILAFYTITTGDESEARRRMSQVFAQPRVPRQQVEALVAAFQKQFGRPPR